MIHRRSVDSTIRMLAGLKEKYPGIKGFTFVDDVLAREGEWFDKFTRRYQAETGLLYAYTSQPLLFNERVAAQLRDSGCKVKKMGLESGNERFRRKELNRNISNKLIMDVFNIAKRNGLKPQSSNMIGMPGETIDDMMETIRLNALIKSYIVWLSVFNPYPIKKLYQECIKNNVINEFEWDLIDSHRSGTVLKDECISSLRLEKVRLLFR